MMDIWFLVLVFLTGFLWGAVITAKIIKWYIKNENRKLLSFEKEWERMVDQDEELD